MRTSHILAAALTIAGCVTACARSEPAEDRTIRNVQVAESLSDGLTEDEEQTTPGSWQPGAIGAAQSVAFQAANGQLLLNIYCDERGGMIVQRPGLVNRGNLALLQMRTGDTVRRLAITTSAGSNPQVQATIPYNDQLLGALMRFDEPLEVRFEGLETLVLPPSRAVGDLVRTCQSGAGTARDVTPNPSVENETAPAVSAETNQPAATQQ